MLDKKLSLLLFIIIFVEGFFTLSLELLVIRQTVPFVGNGTEMVSIIISSVLFPLSLGYYYGGQKFSKSFQKRKSTKIRTLLIKNLYSIVLLTGIGFSYITIDRYFYHAPFDSLMLSLSVYLFLFLVIPSFLLGQTVPLISNYFSSEEISKITGKILFLSTAGSFSGSIIIVLVMMRFIGVSYSLFFIEILLLILVILLSKNKIVAIFNSTLILLLLYGLLSFSFQAFKIEYENTYSTVSIIEENNETRLRMNNSLSSMTKNKNTEFYKYVNTINKMLENQKDKDILVIGAGGFTVGFNDKENNYIYIDIDRDLKELVEAKFLKEKIKKNKIFIAGEIRKYLKESKKKFDFIIVDAYTNQTSIPISLVSYNFYTLLKKSLKENGIVISNMVMDMYLRTTFSKNIDDTLRRSFPSVIMIPLVDIKKQDYSFKNKSLIINLLYILKNEDKKKTIYTDDKNNCTFDKFE